jgi:hypothetical protein
MGGRINSEKEVKQNRCPFASLRISDRLRLKGLRNDVINVHHFISPLTYTQVVRKLTLM